MPDLLDKCRSCEEPIWDGPCKCKTWCKSRVCKASFIGKMSELMVAEQLANQVLTMEQWYEQTQQGRRERITQEPGLLPESTPYCTCSWCREIEHRVRSDWPTRGPRRYRERELGTVLPDTAQDRAQEAREVRDYRWR